MGWEIPFKIIAALASVVVVYLQARSFIQSAHSTLKTDLEILKLLSISDPHYEAVKAHVDKKIAQTFGAKNARWWRDPDFFKGGAILLFFSLMTVIALLQGLIFWTVLLGLMALIGLGGILAAWDRTRGCK